MLFFKNLFLGFLLISQITIDTSYKVSLMQSINSNINYLDKLNIERLEKMFYLKNNRYSPFKNVNYVKYIKGNNSNYTNNFKNNQLNITEFLENLNEEFLNNYNEQLKSQQEDEEGFREGNEEEHQKFFKNFKNRDMGSLDSAGVFRYNKGLFIPTRISAISPSGGGESSSDNNFEIIKQSDFNFKDVGGYKKIKDELMQCADILINYPKYQKYNVRPPKGIIFEGPPGNGKTLMAKAFSGQLNISFIPVSGSEFSEKYVGVGAGRVRELFKLAQSNKPCIIFIDEIDALARKRGNDMVSSNSEKDQTLNQLLINLDGFKGSDGVFVIGATNRIDLLDAALMRPGRMDKNIYIGNPDTETRKAIINIHLSGKPYNNEINIAQIIELTNGFSGAQIENLLNEAMLHALREDREEIMLNDLEYISNRIISGWQSTENKFSNDIIEKIVIHEMGHAMVGFLSPNHSGLVKVCLNLWSPKMPGFTVFENGDQDMNIYTKEGLISHLMVLMGGRVAEEIFYGYSITTGARKDLEDAYKLAQNMVLHYGMGGKSIYPDMSEHSKYLIDQEINKLLLIAHEGATEIIKDAKEVLLDCSIILKENNILKPENISDIILDKHRYLLTKYKILDKYMK